MNKSNAPFNFKDFSNLDNSEDAVYLVKSMDKMYSLDTIRAIKKRAISLLELKSGSNVIELGCGLGQDSEAMAEIVGESGQVISIDFSKLMLSEAKRRSTHKNVDYKLGKVNDLPYSDSTFDAAYADRLLVSQKDYLKVVSEMFRVIKPGGRICITDIDFGTAFLYPRRGALTDILIGRLCEITENPRMGRELPIIIKNQGLQNIKIFPEAYIVRSLELVKTMIDFPRMINDLYELGRYSKEETDLVLNDLLNAEKTGDFMYGIILLTVSGTKPN
jgi:ubiquinone/menaquinone biosynthesis C-methylase UbiE